MKKIVGLVTQNGDWNSNAILEKNAISISILKIVRVLLNTALDYRCRPPHDTTGTGVASTLINANPDSVLILVYILGGTRYSDTRYSDTCYSN